MSVHNFMYSPDLLENFPRDVSLEKEDVTKFRKSSGSGCRSRNFLKDSSTLQGGAFSHRLAHTSEKKTDMSSWKFHQDVSFDKEVPTKFWKSCVPDMELDWICLGEVCTLWVLLSVIIVNLPSSAIINCALTLWIQHRHHRYHHCHHHHHHHLGARAT